LKISSLEGEVRSLAIEFPGVGTLNIDYRPGAFNRKLQRQIADFEALTRRKQEAGEELSEEEENQGASFAVSLIASWDLVEEDGTPVPVSAGVLLDRLGFARMRVIVNALVEALNPNA
jgi:hypothetical protein